MKKLMFTMLVVCLVAATGCGKKTESEQPEKTQVEEKEADTVEDPIARVNELLARENEIFDANLDSWNKVFEAMKHEDAMADPTMNYADFLAKIIEENNDLFTEEEKEQLEKDLEEIFAIEEEIMKYGTIQMGEEGESVSAEETENPDAFPAFTGKDFDGNTVDQELFKKNKATIVNLWFNGCKPCVMELPTLDKINQELKSKGCEVIGINSEALDGNEGIIEEAKYILEKQGTTYRNIYFDSQTEAGQFVRGIMTFPTTIVVDQNGIMVGEPILGGVDYEENYKKLMELVEPLLEK